MWLRSRVLQRVSPSQSQFKPSQLLTCSLASCAFQEAHRCSASLYPSSKSSVSLRIILQDLSTIMDQVRVDRAHMAQRPADRAHRAPRLHPSSRRAALIVNLDRSPFGDLQRASSALLTPTQTNRTRRAAQSARRESTPTLQDRRLAIQGPIAGLGSAPVCAKATTILCVSALKKSGLQNPTAFLIQSSTRSKNPKPRPPPCTPFITDSQSARWAWCECGWAPF